jgi:phosphoribosylformylglycinamidine cyclo-ligase
MGHGFAIYCEAGSGDRIVESAEKKGLAAVVAGAVEVGQRRIIVEPLGIEYGSEELRLGPES